jgi:uncharacterized protein YecE (DUF72 family)
MNGKVRVGTSGWHYPSGEGSWNGIFYPPSRGRSKAFDELSFYAEHFDTVEVNATFYGQPKASVSQSWAARTPSGFEFAVKLYQKFTHPRMYAERVKASLEGIVTGDGSPQRDGLDDLIRELGRPSAADVDEFKQGVDPLASVGKLGPLLAQFPSSFKNGGPERDYLARLLRDFEGYAVAVELRHASWSSDMAGTLSLLNAFGAAWTQIDEPKFRFSIRQNLLPNTTGVYYLRLHGRNAAAWWRHDAAEDRYNYLYTPDELTEFCDAAKAAKQLVSKIYLYTNNHFSAKSVANAVMIKQQIGEPVSGQFSEPFVERYPALRSIVKTAPTNRLV